MFMCLVLFYLLSCNIGGVDSGILFTYQVPEQLDDGWETASITDVGLDETVIAQLMDILLNDMVHMIHSILIVKDGKLVFEEYFSGYAFYHGPFTEFDRETKHNMASVTKSFTSALIGLAIDHGFIQDVDQKLFSFFPENSDLNNGGRDTITLEHLLTMTSGLDWDESTYPYSDPRNDIYQLWQQNDPIRYILNKPIVTEPGTQFNYSSGLTILLGEIIRDASGSRADDFANEYLFSPLGITDYEWEELPNGVLFTSGDMKLRPRDMAKLGDLYLHGGVWRGQQIISGEWVDVSTEFFINASPYWDYGYKWWLFTYEIESEQIESFMAQGWGGQYIIVIPSLDMVIATTAGYYDEPESEFHVGGLVIPVILSAAL